MTNYKPFSFLMGISMGKLPDFEYRVGKWLKYDRSGYNSSHPSLGSPWDLGNPWRPLATMPENGQNGHFQLQPVYWLKKTRRFAWRPQSPGITTTTHGIVTVSRKLRWPGSLKSISSSKLYRLDFKWFWWATVHLIKAEILWKFLV